MIGLRKGLRDLLSPAEEDKFLTSIGAAYPSHRFLANSTQSVYLRYIEDLSRLLTARHQRPPSEISVLDWGAGKGHITYLLRRKGFQVTTCDVEHSDVDSTFGQETPIIDQLKATVIPLRTDSALPFDDGSFDCVVSFGVIEHVPSDTDSMKELRRVLKPGGQLFMTFVPYFLSWTQAVARLRGETYHDRLYSRKRILQLARESQFQVESLGFGQLFPKNSVPRSWAKVLEPLDRTLCTATPMRYLATNLKVVLTAA